MSVYYRNDVPKFYGIYLIVKTYSSVEFVGARKYQANSLSLLKLLYFRINIVYNSDTTMGETIRYFMYKYNISYNDWYGNLSNIYVKIDTNVRSITNYDNICITGAIRELCEARDSGVPQFVGATQLKARCTPEKLTILTKHSKTFFFNHVVKNIVNYQLQQCYLKWTSIKGSNYAFATWCHSALKYL